MKTILKNSTNLSNDHFKNEMTYEDYSQFIKTLADNGGTSGLEQTEALINYTKLNARRMKRWEKTIKITPEATEKIKAFNKPLTWIVLSETWCGDAAHVLPVLNKIALLNENINLKIILRDEHDDLMNQFLTNGGKAIPKLIAVNENFEVKFTYGPRPFEATKMVNDFKQAHGQLTPEFKEDLQRWYNKNKGQAIVNDIVLKLKQSH